ncbi:MAG: hypothetical protein AAGA54_34650 [Myxococcota bacterium]
MGSLADAAGKFAEKLADVLDVFDLSFFVAGSAALGALLVWLSHNGVDVPEGLSTDRALVAVIAAYVLGLVTYALGRAARKLVLTRIFRPRDTAAQMKELFTRHKLARVSDFATYESNWNALYSRLWVLVRTDPALRETYALVRRYWVLCAAYDGIGCAALLWLFPLWDGLELPLPIQVVLTAGLLGAALVAWRQASQYHAYQVDELAATAAHWHTLDPSSAAAASVPPPTTLGVDAE